jgi:hypothetical protein
LADLLEEEEDFSEAARVLMAIPLDAGHRYVLTALRFYKAICDGILAMLPTRIN